MNPKPLAELLQYQNDDVVHRFATDYGVALAAAHEVFTETKRWIWLSASLSPRSIHLATETRAIDSMWATFIGYTHDYTEFCDAYLGGYLHRRPRSRAESLAWSRRCAEDPTSARRVRQQNLRAAYETIGNLLGPETLKKWFVEFPERFPNVR